MQIALNPNLVLWRKMGITSTRIEDGLAIITWGSTKLIGDPEALKLRDEVQNVLDKGAKKIVVDFSLVDFSNSTGLGILVSSWKNAQENGAELVAVVSNERIDKIFYVTNLKSIMNTYKTLDEAKKSFSE